MSAIEKKLAGLGLELPTTPISQGSYVPAIQSNHLVFVSGQLPMKAGKLLAEGRVGQEISLEEAQKAAAQCFLNALAAFKSLGLSLDQISRVIKLNGYVQCTESFKDQPKVINGASDLAVQIFGEAGKHARAAVGAYALPLNAAVEVEVIFEISV